MRQAGEPSVEEILSSIKKVIARDSRIDSAKRDDLRTHGRVGRGGDVLDLTNQARVAGSAQPDVVGEHSGAVHVPVPVYRVDAVQQRDVQTSC